MQFYDRFNSDENNLVDFKKTIFHADETTYPVSIMALPTEEEGILGDFQVNSWSEYHKLREKIENDSAHKFILPKDTLYIKQKHFLDLDLFYISFKNHGLYNFIISEKLKNALTESRMSGFKIEPLTFKIELS